jgi:hypothetical protein
MPRVSSQIFGALQSRSVSQATREARFGSISEPHAGEPSTAQHTHTAPRNPLVAILIEDNTAREPHFARRFETLVSPSRRVSGGSFDPCDRLDRVSARSFRSTAVSL